VFPRKSFALANLPEELDDDRRLGVLRPDVHAQGRIVYADRVTTVSPAIREESRHRNSATAWTAYRTRLEDLHGLLNRHRHRGVGPKIDSSIPANTESDDLSGKSGVSLRSCSTNSAGENSKGPIFGMFARFTPEKGLDLILAMRRSFREANCRW